jgi:hypothetical protein
MVSVMRDYRYDTVTLLEVPVYRTHTHIVLYVHVLFVRTCLSVVAKYDRCTNY